MNFETRIKELKLELPVPPKPVGSYIPVLIEGKTAYLSGQISKSSNGSVLTGKVGSEIDLDEAKNRAREAALNALGIMQHMIGFARIKRIVKVVGYVQTSPDFYQIPAVVNGASDLLLDVFGECGLHARSAVGVSSLPLNASVEIEITLQLND